ncbi:MAG: hypothetical protein PHF84_11125 [bacterium]|nr:hypothetical protein [bacterium]
MAILPIDIQTIIGQMENVGKSQQKLENTPLNQQQFSGTVIHKQTDQQTHQVTTLQHTDNEDKKINPDKENRNQAGRQRNQAKKKGQDNREQDVLFKDPMKGTIIDIKK